jgi:large subunit ribosomal protein L21
MHAIIRVGSHQYDVSPGQTVTMEKLDGPVGSEVRFTDVLFYSDGQTVKAKPPVAGSVMGKIVSQFRGPKLIIFHKKRKKGHTRKLGHRQSYTKVEITGIEA